MKYPSILLLGLQLIFVQGSKSSKSHKVVCYLGSWANYRHGDGKFVIEDIDPTLCTHLVYGFAKLSDNKIAVYDTYLDLKENYGLGAYQRFNDLKKQNPGLKTLIAIGGWNEGSKKYSEMAASPSTRRIFVDSCLEFLTKYGFDGLDLDWEYPANRGGRPSDKQNFVSLIRELKEAFEQPGFLLTAAVSAGKHTIDSAYDIPSMAKYLDFINLMAYDFHGGWEQVTGHNAPLYARTNESAKILNVDYAVNYWLSKGCPAEKLILGMPLYGRGFTLQDPESNGLDAPVNGKSTPGEYTREPGMIGYNEFCKMLNNDHSWKVVFESNTQAPYASKGNQWIGYDNPKSIYLKVQYLLKKKLGGGMVWSLETDDFRGRCHGQRYPLLRAINEGLNGRSSNVTVRPNQENSMTPEVIKGSSPTPVPSAGTTPTSEVKPGTNGQDLLPCTYSGYFRHPRDCKLFYYCQPKSGQSKENLFYIFRCSEGTVFSQALRVCTYPNSVPGCS